jgi:hypothetical protein
VSNACQGALADIAAAITTLLTAEEEDAEPVAAPAYRPAARFMAELAHHCGVTEQTLLERLTFLELEPTDKRLSFDFLDSQAYATLIALNKHLAGGGELGSFQDSTAAVAAPERTQLSLLDDVPAVPIAYATPKAKGLAAAAAAAAAAESASATAAAGTPLIIGPENFAEWRLSTIRENRIAVNALIEKGGNTDRLKEERAQLNSALQAAELDVHSYATWADYSAADAAQKIAEEIRTSFDRLNTAAGGHIHIARAMELQRIGENVAPVHIPVAYCARAKTSYGQMQRTMRLAVPGLPRVFPASSACKWVDNAWERFREETDRRIASGEPIDLWFIVKSVSFSEYGSCIGAELTPGKTWGVAEG